MNKNKISEAHIYLIPIFIQFKQIQVECQCMMIRNDEIKRGNKCFSSPMPKRKQENKLDVVVMKEVESCRNLQAELPHNLLQINKNKAWTKTEAGSTIM